MSNILSQSGFNNLGIQNINDSTIIINQISDKEVELCKLKERLQELEEMYDLIPEERKAEINAKILDQKNLIEQFTLKISQLYKTIVISRIEVNLESQVKAKSAVEQGDFQQAKKILLKSLPAIDASDHRINEEIARTKELLEELKT